MEAKLERAKADLKLLKRAVREREERATQAEAALKEGEATLAAAREELAAMPCDRGTGQRGIAAIGLGIGDGHMGNPEGGHGQLLFVARFRGQTPSTMTRSRLLEDSASGRIRR